MRFGRHAPPKPIERYWTTSSILIRDATPEAVWELISHPRSARLLDEDLVEAYTEPGTGPGVGEVQTIVRRYSGVETTSRIAVTRCVPPTFAETKSLDAGPPCGSRYELASTSDGVLLRFSSWADLPPDAELTEKDLELSQDTTDAFVLAVQRHFEELHRS